MLADEINLKRRAGVLWCVVVQLAGGRWGPGGDTPAWPAEGKQHAWGSEQEDSRLHRP